MSRNNAIIRDRIIGEFPEINPKTINQMIALIDASLRELSEPQKMDQVSIDVSLDENNPYHRIFATIEGKQEAIGAPNDRVWLASMDGSNFDEEDLRSVFEARFPVPDGVFYNGTEYEDKWERDDVKEKASEYNGTWQGFKAAHGLKSSVVE